MSTALFDFSHKLLPIEHRFVDQDTEWELLNQLRAGDPHAFDQLARDHAGRMFAVAGRLLPCPHDRADAVQDALLSAFRSISGFEGNCKLSTWLHEVTVNACLMSRRSRRRRPQVGLGRIWSNPDSIDAGRTRSQDDPFAGAMALERRMLVRKCIDRLPELYRKVLLLRDIEGLDTKQTAHALRTTAGNVKTRLHRARRSLRRLLEQWITEE